jgi:predicted dienelactone hydrolase
MSLLAAGPEDIGAPVLLVAGDLDVTTPLSEEAGPGYDAAPAPKGLVALQGVGHLGFTDLCTPALRETAILLAYPQDLVDGLLDGCGEAYADPAWTTGQTARASTAWLDLYLREEASAARWLEPDGWDPGVTVTTDPG